MVNCNFRVLTGEEESISFYSATWKTQQWTQDRKRSVFIPIPKKGNAKECSNYHTTALISHASKVMLKILQDRLQRYVNRETPDVQPGFRKALKKGLKKADIKLPISVGSQKKQESYRKTFTSASLTMLKPLTVWITTNRGKFFSSIQFSRSVMSDSL